MASLSNNDFESRAKISKTLKEKWQDPAFREKMIQAMTQNRKKSSPTSQSQREKISAAMKKKWQDTEYRKKALKGMEAYRESLPPPKPKPMVSRAASTINLDNVFAVTPMKTGNKKKRKKTIKVNSTNANAAAKKPRKTRKKSAVKLAKKPEAKVLLTDEQEPSNGKTMGQKEDGDISRMREERRDLYDLLYGDEPEEDASEEAASFNPVIPDPVSLSQNSATSFFGGDVDLDDDNLDNYDPYGLD